MISRKDKKVWIVGVGLLVGIGLVYFYPVRLGIGTIEERIEAAVSKKKAAPVEMTKVETGNARLTFVGDAMLDRYIREVGQKRGASFLIAKTKDIFAASDATVLNLEGPITDNASVSQSTVLGDKTHLTFTFDPRTTADFLRNIHSPIAALGNNHILNFGAAGLESTQNYLRSDGVDYFADVKGRSAVLEKTINGRKMAFVGYNQFFGDPPETTIERIKQAKEAQEFVVVYAHWGAEYARGASAEQTARAHQFIDAGADLIIGSHPHVVEPIEVYKNKVIFYSLGNFIFDQYFSPDTMQGLAVGVSLQEDTSDFYLFPLRLNRDGSTTLAEGKAKNDLLIWLAESSNLSDNQKNELKNGSFSIKSE